MQYIHLAVRVNELLYLDTNILWRIISWSQSIFAWHSGAIRMKCGCEMKPVDTGFSYPSPLLRSTYLWKPIFFSMKSFQFTCWTNINDIPQPRECSSSGWMCFWTTWSSKNVHAHGRGSCWFFNFWFLIFKDPFIPEKILSNPNHSQMLHERASYF